MPSTNSQYLSLAANAQHQQPIPQSSSQCPAPTANAQHQNQHQSSYLVLLGGAGACLPRLLVGRALSWTTVLLPLSSDSPPPPPPGVVTRPPPPPRPGVGLSPPPPTPPLLLLRLHIQDAIMYEGGQRRVIRLVNYNDTKYLFPYLCLYMYTNNN